MEGKYKGKLRKIDGVYYLNVENKGYILYPETYKMLKSILPSDVDTIGFSTHRTNDTIAEAHICNNGDKRSISYVDNFGRVLGNTVDCPHIFEDYDVPEVCYINYNPEW